MFVSLILLLIPFFTCFGELPNPEELSQFAKSDAYRNLYYTDEKSTAFHDQFFLAKAEGRMNLDHELKESINIFKLDLEKRCYFPARFKLIQKQWPHLFQGNLEHCHELKEWMHDLPVDEVSLVFSGAYINNPASMFGHVFLNLNHSSLPKLLGYSLSYEASIDPNDLAVFYMLKGLFGGYMGFFNLKPYYENVGAYNNAESRELWEYPLDFSENEILFLKYHLWEVIHHSGFKYFFTHKNCASYLARFLMAIKPSINLPMSRAVLSFPHKMLKDAIVQVGAKKPRYRSSLKNKIINQYEKLNGTEKELFLKTKRNLSFYKDQLPRNVLELLVDDLKFINYKKGTNLSSNEKVLFDQALMRLSSNTEEIKSEHKIEATYFPHESHDAKKVRMLFTEKRETNFSFRLGEHNYEDKSKGYNKTSYVEFGKIGFQYNDSESKARVNELTFIDLLSLNPFSVIFPLPSWAAGFSYLNECSLCKNSEKNSWAIHGAIGFSKLLYSEKIQLSAFTGLQALSFKKERSHQKARIYNELLFKIYFSESFFYLSKLQKTWEIEKHLSSTHNVSYAFSRNNQLGVGWEYKQEFTREDSKLKLFLDFYL